MTNKKTKLYKVSKVERFISLWTYILSHHARLEQEGKSSQEVIQVFNGILLKIMAALEKHRLAEHLHTFPLTDVIANIQIEERSVREAPKVTFSWPKDFLN